MRRIGVVLLLVATNARADDVADAIGLLKINDEWSMIRGARKVQALGPRAKRAARLLAKHLANEDYGIWIEMQRALVAIGAKGVPALLSALKRSKHITQRRKIAATLAKIGLKTPKHNNTLTALLADPDQMTRRSLGALLAKQGGVAVPPLIKALGSRSAEQRTGAAWTLGKIGTPALQATVKALAGTRAAQRAGAADVLGFMGSKGASAAPRLRTLVADAQGAVRLAAVRALGRIKAEPPQTVPVLIGALGDADAGVCAAAIVSVARFGKDAAELLVSGLGGKSGAATARALLRIGIPSLDALEQGLKSDHAPVRAGSARTLGRGIGLFAKDYVDGIEGLLEDSEVAVRLAAANALARRGYPSSVEPLATAAADDADASVRAAALRALGQADLSDAVLAAVRKAATDGDARVKVAAAAALWSLGEPSHVLELARGLLAGDDARLRDAACLALQPMGRAAKSAIPDLIAAGRENASMALVDALGAIASAHGGGLLDRARRYRHAPPRTHGAIDAALDWLKRFQDTRASGKNKKDGRWHPVLFTRHDATRRISGTGGALYSAGVTGLALCAFLAVGREDDPAVREGLDYLIHAQRPDGLFAGPRSQHFQIDQAYATAAVCEAWIVTHDPRLRRTARRAVAACLVARNPDLAWRYEPRGGENDTHVTVAVLHAIAIAERGGLEVDPDAFVGAAQWIDAMTDPEFGQVGYNMPGGSPARPEGLQDAFPPEKSQSMTAMGVLARILLGDDPSTELNRKGTRLCLEQLPKWRSDGSIDMYFWYYGTLALHAGLGKADKRWYATLTKALVPHQRTESAFAGSWDPAGPWGSDGGRVYSTAICALALATPYRLSSSFAARKPIGAYAAAVNALKKIAKSGDPGVRARAALWVRRAGG